MLGSLPVILAAPVARVGFGCTGVDDEGVLRPLRACAASTSFDCIDLNCCADWGAAGGGAACAVAGGGTGLCGPRCASGDVARAGACGTGVVVICVGASCGAGLDAAVWREPVGMVRDALALCSTAAADMASWAIAAFVGVFAMVGAGRAASVGEGVSGAVAAFVGAVLAEVSAAEPNIGGLAEVSAAAPSICSGADLALAAMGVGLAACERGASTGVVAGGVWAGCDIAGCADRGCSAASCASIGEADCGAC